jgi:glycosyltransferase involved in cell wall biosynthesis
MFFFFMRNINTRFGMQDIARPDVFYSRAVGRYSFRPFIELLELVRKKRVGILHLNGNKSVIAGVLLKMLFLHRLKLVAHEHGGVFDYTRWYPLFLKLSQRWIDLFITVSNYRKRFLVSRSGIDPDKIRVINNFVDPGRLKRGGANATAGREKNCGEFVIGYVGGLSRIKGCDVLIRAIPLLKDQIGKLKVVIAGDGPARTGLEELAGELSVGGMITFLGFVATPGEAYNMFDLMVIPSRSEEGPITLYESWAMGIPVVASNAPVLDERIRDGETGIFFQSENHAELAEKILLAYRDSELVSRIREGGAREAEQLSVERHLADLRDMYRSL